MLHNVLSRCVPWVLVVCLFSGGKVFGNENFGMGEGGSNPDSQSGEALTNMESIESPFALCGLIRMADLSKTTVNGATLRELITGQTTLPTHNATVVFDMNGRNQNSVVPIGLADHVENSEHLARVAVYVDDREPEPIDLTLSNAPTVINSNKAFINLRIVATEVPNPYFCRANLVLTARGGNLARTYLMPHAQNSIAGMSLKLPFKKQDERRTQYQALVVGKPGDLSFESGADPEDNLEGDNAESQQTTFCQLIPKVGLYNFLMGRTRDCETSVGSSLGASRLDSGSETLGIVAPFSIAYLSSSEKPLIGLAGAVSEYRAASAGMESKFFHRNDYLQNSSIETPDGSALVVPVLANVPRHLVVFEDGQYSTLNPVVRRLSAEQLFGVARTFAPGI